jgi:GntR family transcriptional regulator/MocR family aminotransferase
LAIAFPIDGIIIDRSVAANLHRQLYSQLRGLIERRVLPSGTALPSTRLLTKDLGIGRNTVIAAYEQLALEGYVLMRRGSPPLVMDLPATVIATEKPHTEIGSTLSARGKIMLAQPHHHGSPGLLAFHPGLPDSDNFPFTTWSKLLGKRAKLARHDLFGTYHIGGYPPLCEAIARYLTASRGMTCKPEQIVITNGAQSAFDLLARILIDPDDTVWLEEPGYYGAGSAFLSAGANLAPLRVSDNGWDLEPPPVPPRLIFVTPSCHQPLGVTMPMEQRLNLIHMAERWNSWIIEDDYDSEFRYGTRPIPCLHGLNDDGRVIYVGSFSKTLFPALRLGFLIIPLDLHDAVIAARRAGDIHPSVPDQAILAEFMAEGHFERHLRRMRSEYQSRLEALATAAARHCRGALEIRPVFTGLHAVGDLADVDDALVFDEAMARGVEAMPLSRYYFDRRGPAARGLVLGFAAIRPELFDAGMRELAAAIEAAGRRMRSR